MASDSAAPQAPQNDIARSDPPAGPLAGDARTPADG
ncbi:hypothetical protein C357_19566, partial [Citreicella sp. 357]